MKKVNKVLSKYSISPADLPAGLKAEFDALNETVKKYNDAVKVYEDSGEKDAATEDQLDNTERLIDENETSLSDKIDAEFKQKKEEADEAARLAKEAKDKEEAEAANPVETAVTEVEAEVKKENNDGTLGWLAVLGLSVLGLGFLAKRKR